MSDADTDQDQVLPRLGLREELRPVVEDEDSFARSLAEIALGEGPIALDVERASGYRYSQRAYLIQVRRHGAGTFLIDPVAFDDLAELGAAFGREEWILHAATQDLPSLHAAGLKPVSLFDTELAGRLLNLPKVGLASLVEHYLGLSMAKEHSAADWSTRPLPEPWLEYAALDVEVLVELREAVIADLKEAEKLTWARQEFDALLDFTGPAPRKDPWRRTSGIHRVRNRRALALVRSLWQTRDRLAAEHDVTPGRILRDHAILDLATDPPGSRTQLRGHVAMRNSRARKHLDSWHAAIEEALSLDDQELPSSSMQHDGPPPARAWADKDPAAAERLSRARAALAAIAEDHNIPTENVIGPAHVRQLAWEPPVIKSVESISAMLRELGSRPWQIELTSEALAEALWE